LAVAHRIYAEALFEAAKEQGTLQQVREELADFVAAVHDTPELRGLLRNPQLDSRTKQSILTDLLGDANELLRNFLLLTTEKGRIGEIEAIGAEFERLMAREERRLDVELTTAKELSDEEAAGIIRQIEKASGRKVEAARRVDPALIGGIILRVGTLEVDASIRGRLERLRHELVRS
jgi:F-type H+-transporting ATPase subunit delta